MIKQSNFRGRITNIHQLFVGEESIAAVYIRNEKVWPLSAIGQMILSCYYNGYWEDAYPWTDDTPWKD